MNDRMSVDASTPARANAPVSSDTPVAAVELRGVTKTFGSAVALDGISLTIRKGEFFSLLGASGCGKTTTLNLIGGFESATSGTLLIDGQPVQHTPAHARPVNTVFQSYALFPHMSVAENVEFGLRMKKVPVATRREAVTEMLRLVSLEGYDQRRPNQLSGGQRQRVALARALINRPSVLLLDEPLGALDLKLRKLMQTELTRIQRQVGITFVYVTHDQEEALAMSDRIAVMDHGRLLQVGTPTEVYDLPANRGVMEFIGTVNAFEGCCSRSAAKGDIVSVEFDGGHVVHGVANVAMNSGSPATLLVRPERIRLAAQPADSGPALRGTVGKIAHLGFVTHCTVRLPIGRDVLAFRLNVEGSRFDDFREGQAVFLSWQKSDAHVFPADAQTQPIEAPQAAPR
jgi:spermidine/putrescine transport system ATP-binding protein